MSSLTYVYSIWTSGATTDLQFFQTRHVHELTLRRNCASYTAATEATSGPILAYWSRRLNVLNLATAAELMLSYAGGLSAATSSIR